MITLSPVYKTDVNPLKRKKNNKMSFHSVHTESMLVNSTQH